MKNISTHLMTILFFSLFALFFIKCSKSISPTGTTPNEHRSDSTYFGSWNWILSSGGIAGQTITPATTGYTIKIILKQDRTRESYKNDTLTATTHFRIQREKMYMDSIDVIYYVDSVRFMPQYISLRGRDTLYLVDRCMDCYWSLYSRLTDLE